MTDISRLDGIDVKRSVIDSVLAGLCALIVFGPIVGIVLKGTVLRFPHSASSCWWRW